LVLDLWLEPAFGLRGKFTASDWSGKIIRRIERYYMRAWPRVSSR
jgi:hypothetical protein